MGSPTAVRDDRGIVLDLLEDAAASTGRMRFLPGDDEVSLGAMWHQAHAACAWYQDRMAAGSTVAVVMDSSAAALAALAGGWLAGMRVASLAAVPQGADDLAHLGDGVDGGPAVPLLTAARQLPADREAVPFEALVEADRQRARPTGGGHLVQHTSGSTGRPKGIVLSLAALAANVEAIIDVFQDGSPLTTVSWLPLSHDMGLVGLCLAPWAYTGRVVGGGTIALMAPDYFLRSPSSWLRTCSEERAHATCGPDFALDLIGRRPPRAGLDLSALRIVCSGSEPVRAATLRTFVAATAPLGMSPLAPCPAYGLAEATLAVTCVRPSEPWRAVTVDPVALGDGDWVEVDDGIEIVSAGRPVLGTEVAVSDRGEVVVRTPSACEGYADGATSPIGADGWLATGDTGVLRDGELFVTGRIDATMHIGGRAVSAAQVEHALDRVVGVARGRGAAFLDDGRYTLVAERARGVGEARLPVVAADIRRELVRAVGVAPGRIVVLAPRAFPTTPNGKVRHHAVTHGLRTGGLDVEWDSARPDAPGSGSGPTTPGGPK